MTRAIRDGRTQENDAAGAVQFRMCQRSGRSAGLAGSGQLVDGHAQPRAVGHDNDLEDDWAQAKAKGQQEIIRWASQHLNIEIGLALRTRSMGRGRLLAGAVDDTLTLDTILDRSEVIVIGIDGGGLDDLLGLAVLGRDAVTQDLAVVRVPGHTSPCWCAEKARGIGSARLREGRRAVGRGRPWSGPG